MPLPLFIAFAALASIGAIVMVTRRNPISSALALTVSLIALAGLFAGLSAHFLFAIQLLVYAGAIMVLVIFVIMLLNLRDEDLKTEGLNLLRGGAATIAGIVIFVALARLFARVRVELPAAPADFGQAQPISRLLFTDYVVPFEIVSLVLLVAIVGAVVVAKRHF
jgi:NADH-quinone oxidoreductase subunit J